MSYKTKNGVGIHRSMPLVFYSTYAWGKVDRVLHAKTKRCGQDY